MSARAIRCLAGLVMLALGSACAAPAPPIEAGVREFPTDVLLGSADEAAPQPTGRRAPGPEPAAPILVRPVPVARPSPGAAVETPGPCPESDPRTPPRRQALQQADSPPVAETYPFRNSGSYSVVGGAAETGTYRASQRSVSVVGARSGGFDFEVRDTLGITTRYRSVYGDSLDGRDLALDPGLYITSVTSETAEGVSTFSPVQPIPVVAYPLNPGNRLEARGASPTGSTVMTFRSQVGRTVDGVTQLKARVDACGTMLDAYWVELSDGRIAGPDKDLRFTSVLGLGTQYGGLVLLEEMTVAGTDGGATVESRRRSVISREPKVPS